MEVCLKNAQNSNGILHMLPPWSKTSGGTTLYIEMDKKEKLLW
jgi:hypothetical protein